MVQGNRSLVSALSVALLLAVVHGWQSPGIDRRQAIRGIASTTVGVLVTPSISNAGIDPTMLKNLPVQGDETGAAQRLRQVEAVQRPTSDLVDIPFTDLPSGASFREYREGKGEAGTMKMIGFMLLCLQFRCLC